MRMLEEMLNDPEWRDSVAAWAGLEMFVIDNVAEYLYARTDQETWDVKQDFPCLAPPFPAFWMEFSRPSKIESREFGTRSSQGLPYRSGFLFEYTALTEQNMQTPEQLQAKLNKLRTTLNQEFTPQIDAELKAVIASGADIMDFNDDRWQKLSVGAGLARGHLLEYAFTNKMLNDGVRPMLAAVADKGAHWIARCVSFMQVARNDRILGPLAEQNIVMTRNGDVIEQSFSWNTKVLRGERANDISTLWFPALLAISFCHCRNVAIKTETKPGKLLKRQTERGHQAVATYKILEITPMKAILKSAGAEHPDTGLRRAMHICRGHFAHYEDKGLFGKYKGRFWIPQHIRGSAAQGAVFKDYVIRTGAKGH